MDTEKIIPEITVYGLVCYLCLASKSDEDPSGELKAASRTRSYTTVQMGVGSDTSFEKPDQFSTKSKNRLLDC